MDPITVAIFGALGKISADAISGSYQALKAAIAKKYGVDSDVSKAIDDVEKKPDSAGRKETLKEEIATAKLGEDPELVKLAETLIEKIKELDKAGNTTSQNITVSGNVDFQTSNVSGGIIIQGSNLTGDVTGGNKS
jgi:hypothetical protein